MGSDLHARVLRIYFNQLGVDVGVLWTIYLSLAKPGNDGGEHTE